MNAVVTSKAREYVRGLQLPESIRGAARRDDDLDAVREAFSSTRQQAGIVGSEIVGFVEGVTPERRQAIVNSTLLAQLAATRQVPDTARVDDWYKAYFDVLSNIGWVVQERSLTEYTEDSDQFEAHKAVLELATALLGPAVPAGVQLVKAALKAMLALGDDNQKWITVFSEESRKASAARFQVGLVARGEAQDFRVALMAFSLEASAEISQVLFFKARSSTVTFRHCSGEVTINQEVLDEVKDEIRLKLLGGARKYVGELKI